MNTNSNTDSTRSSDDMKNVPLTLYISVDVLCCPATKRNETFDFKDKMFYISSWVDVGRSFISFRSFLSFYL